jgi:hypothetical protein
MIPPVAEGSYDLRRLGSRIVLVYHGYHGADEAGEVADRMVQIAKNVEGAIEFIPVLNDLTGYAIATREAYQGLFRALGPRLQRVTIVGGSPLIRMAAAAVCLYGGIKMRTANTLEEILDEPKAAAG